MAASKRKSFVLHHCYKILEHSNKWRLRDQEAPPKKGAFTQMDDDESDKEGGRNKGKPDGRKMSKDHEKRRAEDTSLRTKIDDMVKSKEVLMRENMQAKMIMAEKKLEEKKARWQVLRDFEERRIQLEEKKAMKELIAEENKTMMMDPTKMDSYQLEWWKLARMEILERRKQSLLGGGAPASGGGSASGLDDHGLA